MGSQKQTNLDETISVPVSRQLKALIERVAKADDRKPAQLARRVLERGVREEAEKHGLLSAASPA